MKQTIFIKDHCTCDTLCEDNKDKQYQGIETIISITKK